MMKYIALWAVLLTISSVYGQATFLGFDHPDCRDSLSNTYTYVNWFSQNASSGGFRVYRNGTEVYNQTGQDANKPACLDLQFVNDGVGFMVVYIPLGGSTRLLRTEDYGVTWQQIASGAPNYAGMYIINDWTAYMVTHYFSSAQNIVELSRGSVLISNQDNQFINDQNFTSDIFVTDTLLNADRCDSSSLSFAVAYNGDTVAYHINFEVLNAGISENQVESLATIYPNPTTDVFSLANVTFSGPRGIAIYNTTGMLIKEYTTTEAEANQFSVSELVQGTYFVQIQSSKGNQLLKLIKQ
jgi:hypothetical protein